MLLSICPVARVAAPVAVVWELLQVNRLGTWINGRVEDVTPPGPTVVGQRLTIVAPNMGRDWSVAVVVEVVDAERHELGTYWDFPLELHLHQRVRVTPLDAASCTVQYG